MIQLVSKNLQKTTLEELEKLQQLVNAKSTFAEQVEEAQHIWKTKSSTILGKQIFEEVKAILTQMCLSIEVCNYCEENEANHIEHIHPKSFFPELAFIWDNYLLACPTCNSTYKLDKCYTIDNASVLDILKRNFQPKNGSTIAFINPRMEDPNHYMMLNMETYTFDIQDDLSLLEQYKAEKTIEILNLNERAELVSSRKKTAIYIYNRINQLVHALNAKSNQELEAILTPDDDAVDETKSLQQNKDTITANFKKDIQTHKHPSVWYAIKMVQSKVNDKWKALFSQIPQALNW